MSIYCRQCGKGRLRPSLFCFNQRPAHDIVQVPFKLSLNIDQPSADSVNQFNIVLFCIKKKRLKIPRGNFQKISHRNACTDICSGRMQDCVAFSQIKRQVKTIYIFFQGSAAKMNIVDFSLPFFVFNSEGDIVSAT